MIVIPPKKEKFPLAQAEAIAAELVVHLGDFCDKIIIAGSIRRKKQEVGDIELLYIPIVGDQDSGDLLGTLEPINYFDMAVATLEEAGILERRKNKKGGETFGEKNKLMRHVPTGIPVDLFSTSTESWFNYLTSRTGGRESNVAIATEALRKRLRWNPYGPGFSKADGGVISVHCEEDVFKIVGLPYLPPEERV